MRALRVLVTLLLIALPAPAGAADAHNRFACGLFARLSSRLGSVCFSPLSVRAAWRHPFAERATRPGPFRLGPEETVQVPMMHLTATLPCLQRVGETAEQWCEAVEHKAYVDVNEYGTEAAAATAIAMARKGRPRVAFEFRADRPFFFRIRDRESGHILFFGRVTDPRAA